MITRVYYLYLIPVLHPRYKLGYFEDNNWADGDVLTARGLAEDMFSRYQSAYNEANEDDLAQMVCS